MLSVLQTKGMTLEDISVLFGDPVELSFEQALHKEGTKGVEGQGSKDAVQQVEYEGAANVEEVKA